LFYFLKIELVSRTEVLGTASLDLAENSMKKIGFFLLLVLNGLILFAEGMREDEKQIYCAKLESLIAQGVGKRREELSKIPGLQGKDRPYIEIPYSDSSHRDLKLTLYYNLSPTKTYVDYASIRYSSRLKDAALQTDLDYFFIQAAHFLIYYGAYSERINRPSSGYVYHGEKHTGRLVEGGNFVRLDLDMPADIALFSDPKNARYIETHW
jgi:hypothetical protein